MPAVYRVRVALHRGEVYLQINRTPDPGVTLPPCVKRMLTVPDDGLDQVMVICCPATALKPSIGVLIALYCDCANAMAAQKAKINPKKRILRCNVKLVVGRNELRSENK